MAKISVIMPLYNTKEEYLREAIESILSQTYKDFELIIVDDASTKDFSSLISAYKDNRIIYHRLAQNKGAANARNIAISHAQGEYLAFMDSDDVYLPERFEKQVEFFAKNPDIGCLGTKTIIIGNDCNKVLFPDIIKHKDIECHLIFEGCVFCQSSVMLRKKIIDMYDIKYKNKYVPAEDYALWLDLIGKTKFEVIDEALVKYRFYKENISHRQKDLQSQKCCEAQFEMLQKHCNITQEEKNILISFFCMKKLKNSEIVQLSTIIEKVIQRLSLLDISQKDVIDSLKKRYKRLYYHTHDLSGQWCLLLSPLNRLFKLPLSWRIFCLITRGII